METQEIIKLLAAAMAAICMLMGVWALFKGLKADGEVNLSGLVSGKVKTGSAGVLLLFFGSIVFVALIAKGSHKTETTTISQNGGITNFSSSSDVQISGDRE